MVSSVHVLKRRASEELCSEETCVFTFMKVIHWKLSSMRNSDRAVLDSTDSTCEVPPPPAAVVPYAAVAPVAFAKEFWL